MELTHDVSRINGSVRDILLTHIGSSFIGLIVHGSAVKGGVIPGSSDIDYILYVEDAALNEAGKLSAELCISIHRALSAIEVAPFRYIQFSVLSPLRNGYLGPVPGTYRLLAGRLLVPETTGEALYADAVSSLDALVPALAFDPHRLLDHGEDRIERSTRLMCTIVWPLVFQMLTVLHKDGLRIWSLNKKVAVELLEREPGIAAEITAFYDAVQAYYPQEHSAGKALDVIHAGVQFIRAVKRHWESVKTASSKLILIEGIPGSGKSTAAQHILLTMNELGLPCTWRYEEQRDHPVYIYRNYAEMHGVLAELDQGRFSLLIDRALQQWQTFAAAVQSAPETVVIDSCLFGYLTWSLFPYNAAPADLLAYIRRVGEILRPLNPQLIYFYQRDIGAALSRITARRGGDTEANWIQTATGSAYGKSRGLQGFDGMVSYWEAYRELTDEAFAAWNGSKLSIDNTEGEWTQYGEAIRSFLGLNQDLKSNARPNDIPLPEVEMQDAVDIAGSYRSAIEGAPDCIICMVSGTFIADGLPHAWRSSPLIRTGAKQFQVQSMPMQLCFDDYGFHLTGPDLLDGTIDYRYTRLKPLLMELNNYN